MSVDSDQRVAMLRGRSRRTAASGATPSAESQLLPQQPRIPGRRNPKWIALGVVAICLGGLLSYFIYARVASETTVVAMQETVYRGQLVEAGDLKTITVSGDIGVPTVPGPQLSDLVGQRAAFDLPANSIVAPDAIRATVLPSAGNSLVGLKLSAGRQPGGFLVPGSKVRLIVVPAPNDQSTTVDGFQNKNYPAVIVDTNQAADDGTLLVNVQVANAQAAVIALLAATDRIAVVRDQDR